MSACLRLRWVGHCSYGLVIMPAFLSSVNVQLAKVYGEYAYIFGGARDFSKMQSGMLCF